MTKRQAEALRLRADGLTFAEIGERMGVSRQCVDTLLKGGISDKIQGPRRIRRVSSTENAYGQRLIEWLVDNGMSILMFSKEVGVSYASLLRMLHGDGGLSVKTAEKIYRKTGVSYFECAEAEWKDKR